MNPCEQKDKIDFISQGVSKLNNNMNILIAHHNFEKGKKAARKAFFMGISKTFAILAALAASFTAFSRIF